MNNQRNITVIIQARTGSTRLPGKVLMPLQNRSVLAQVIKQVSYAKKIDQIVVATTDKKSDDDLCEEVKKLSIPYFRGDEGDVLDRYYNCAKKVNASVIVRITSDCPFIDPQIIDQIVEKYLQTNADYCSNVEPPTFPDGLDVEVFSFAALEKSWNEAKLPSEREHVTPYMRNHPELFRIVNVVHTENLEAHRWTLDTPEDYEFLTAIAKRALINDGPVSMKDVFAIIEKLYREDAATAAVNQHIQRNEGMKKSLEEDKSKVHP